MTKARQLADLGNAYDDGALSNRNLIINGAMQVAQRGTSATGVTASQYGPVDRFKCRTHSSAGTVTLAQQSDAPVGFSKSYRCTVTSSGTIEATQSLRLDTLIESKELVRLGHGTSDATGFTVSFWVKSSTTGTYAFNVYQYDGSEQVNQTYTIDASDTWEYKSLSFSGNTGTANSYDNSAGFELAWFLSSGSSVGTASSLSNWTAYTNANYGAGHTANLSGVTNGYLAITGVQLEVGDTATPFEHRTYGEELAKCQRYYSRLSSDGTTYAEFGLIAAYDSTQGIAYIQYPTTMRASPTATQVGNFIASADTNIAISSFTFQNATKNSIRDHVSVASGFGAKQVFRLRNNNDNDAYIEFDAEL